MAKVNETINFIHDTNHTDCFTVINRGDFFVLININFSGVFQGWRKLFWKFQNILRSQM